jgi:xanthine dehydrogenase accessory factor
VSDRLDAAAAAELAADALARDAALAIVLCVAPAPHAGARIAVRPDGSVVGALADPELDTIARDLGRRALDTGTTAFAEAVTVSAGPATLYVEAFRAPERLIVVGAGHIAVPLVRHAVELGFRVTVLDDREDFATPERFSPAAAVLRADFERDPFAGLVIDTATFVVLVTRGHRWDFDCLRRLIDAPALPRYVGMIGSRRRVRAAFGALLDAGYARDTLARVRAPIGIEIGAETPEEIAISIAAELVAVRRGCDIETIAGRERVLDRLLPHAPE